MSFPRYPKYKDSGVDWLGQVPEHWQVTALKRVVNPDRQITYGIVQAGPHVPDGIPYIRPADMTDEHGIEIPDEVMRTSPEIAGNYSRSTICKGDLVCSIGPSFGKVMVTPNWLDGANLTQGTARIAVQAPWGARYFFWTLRSTFSVAQWESSVGGATFRALNLAPLAETTILVPSVDEQNTIAEFLDRETAKIDALVAEQQRLMELLKEKRQAVISHAVTKGLNPKAPLKPSGIDWLGDVPAHWAVERLKYSITKLEQGWSPQCESEPAVDGQWGVLKVGCVNGDHFEPTEQKALPLELAPLPDYEIKAGDILVSRGNTLDLVGMASFVEKVRPRLLLSDLLYRFHPLSGRAEGQFLVLALRSPNVRFQIERDAIGASPSMKKIGQGIVREFVIAIPPLNEQSDIIAFVKAHTAKLDTLTAEAQRAIDLLQERRTALISAAVTGQIDVRPLLKKEAT